MRIIDIMEDRQGIKGSSDPFIALVEDYKFFISMNMIHLDKLGKTPEDRQGLQDIVTTVQKPYFNGKKIFDLDTTTLMNNRDVIKKHIGQMIQYIIPRLQKYLSEEEFLKRKARINKLIGLYNQS